MFEYKYKNSCRWIWFFLWINI